MNTVLLTDHKRFSVPALWFCFLLVLFAAGSRLLPHPPNFTPIGALGLFAGASFGMRRYWLVPLAALLVSDLIIGFYHPMTMVSVYLAFFISAVAGRVFLLEKYNGLHLAATTLSTSVLFFVLSNFGDWLSGINYPLTWAGLVECYVMAIPFFGNTVLGDLFYVTCLFGSYALAGAWLMRRTAQAI